MSFGLLHSASSREQKKLAPRMPCSLHLCATVYAMVDLPVPADPGPFIQNTRAVTTLSMATSTECPRESPRSIQWYIWDRISALVPAKQGSLSMNSNRALIARGIISPPVRHQDLSDLLDYQILPSK